MKKNSFISIKLLVPLLVCALILSCSTYYESTNLAYADYDGREKPEEHGKCFAQSMVLDKFKIVIDTLPVYSNTKNVAHTSKQLHIRDATRLYEKRKKDSNCQSKDPNDCFFWVLIEAPLQRRTYTVPDEPATAGDVSYEIYKSYKLIKKGGFHKWRQVVCAEDIDEDLLDAIKTALTDKGYNAGPIDRPETKLRQKLKSALSNYQIENDLPVGQLDMETLENLDISSALY